MKNRGKNKIVDLRKKRDELVEKTADKIAKNVSYTDYLIRCKDALKVSLEANIEIEARLNEVQNLMNDANEKIENMIVDGKQYECSVNDWNEILSVKSRDPFSAALRALADQAEDCDLKGDEVYRVTVSDEVGNDHQFRILISELNPAQ